MNKAAADMALHSYATQKPKAVLEASWLLSD